MTLFAKLCMRLNSFALVALLLVIAGPMGCRADSNTEADTTAVTSVVDSFYGAMKTASPSAAMALIAEDALFIEGGRLETRAEYEQNHLPADIEFEKAVQGERKSMRVTVDRDAAWVIAATEYHGEFESDPVDFVSTQLMVLSREDSGWKIRSIHWSSRRL